MPGPHPTPAAFAAWLHALPGFDGCRVEAIRPAPGGVSNLTFRVSITGARFAALALRMQRERGIFAPYDVAREARVVACLAASPVPVPAVVGVETDPRPLGAPFAVYEWVDAPHMGEAGGSMQAFTRTVVAIHTLDWHACGLDFLGVPASAADGIAAELHRIAARMAIYDLEGDPLLAAALRQLRSAVPGDGAVALCQGDINVFNYLVRGREVAAVVDWEQARLSDPRSDIAHLLALTHLNGAPFIPADDMPFARAYGAVLGRPVTGLAFFRARWLFELAVIHRILVQREGSSIWYSWAAIEHLLPTALADLP